jgi:hypothetical protein
MKTALKNKLLLLTLAPLLFIVFTTAPSMSTQASSPNSRGNNPFDNVPITGAITSGGTFNGSMDIISFTDDGAGNLLANGLLTGVLRDANGREIGRVGNEYVTLPAQLTAGNGSDAPDLIRCPILHLTLGPLDLNLLGLTVHLDRVVLDITAVGGPGNLLGNLLCAIAHLLDGGPLSELIDLLNRVVDLFGR